MNVTALAEQLAAVAEAQRFSGAVALSRAGEVLFEGAYGWAERRCHVPNTPQTRFGTASGTKTFTALAVARLVERGALTWDSALVDVVKTPLPDVDPAVTVRHLLTHTSGVADYYDESQVEDFSNFFVAIPWYQLRGPRDYLPLLAGRPTTSAPGARFAYNNTGYILLGVLVEDLSGVPYQTFVQQEVFDRAGMRDAGFFALNALPERTATGYIGAGLTTNVYNLPIVGASDGGAFCTVGDLVAFWSALLDGRIVGDPVLAEVLRPHQHGIDGQPDLHYGLGVYRADSPEGRPSSFLHGEDAGVYFRSQCWPDRGVVLTVAANSPGGAGAMRRAALDLARQL